MEKESEIYEIIEKYDFSELTDQQRKLVLSEMTEDGYTNMRKTISLTTDFFDEEPILMAEDLVVPTIKKKSVLVRLINYKLPIYKVAAILMIFLSVNHLTPEEIASSTQLVEDTNEFIIDTDTFLSYNRYASNNSIKYATGLSRVYN
mgnify:CR=1 FL=1